MRTSGVGPSGPAALMIDFGGVLTSSIHDAFGEVSELIGAGPDFLLDYLTSDPDATRMVAELECGRISEGDFEGWLAPVLAARELTPPTVGVVRSVHDRYRPDTEMLEGLVAVRAAGVPVAIVSNSLGTEGYAGFDLPSRADAVVLSGEFGDRKPSPAIYLAAAEALSVDPAACLFVDDFAVNLDGAARLGIETLLHLSAETTLRAFSRRWGIANLTLNSTST